MDFWRIYRLISAKRNLILAIVVCTGVIVWIGAWLRSLNREYSADAVLQPPDPTAAQAEAVPSGTAPVVNINPDQARKTYIADLLMQLRSSTDITNRAVTLLKLPEAERRKEVSRILNKNGYFAQINQDVINRADQAIQSGDITAAERDTWIKTEQSKAQDALTNSLSNAADDAGTFLGGGSNAAATELAARLGKIVSYESVEGPFSTDQDPQVVNQVRIVAASPRAAEAELYANMISVAFLDNFSNRSLGAVTARIESAKQKLKSAQGLYTKAQQAVLNFNKSNRNGVYSSATQQVLTNVENYRNNLNTARQDFAVQTASVAKLQQLVGSTSPTQSVNVPAAESQEVRDLQAQVSRLRIAFNRVKQSNYDTGSEVYKEAKAELDQAEAELKVAQSSPKTATQSNPNFIQLQGQLAQAQVLRDNAANRVQVLTGQLAAEEQKLNALPKTTAILSDLNRDLTIRQNNVDALEKLLANLDLEVIEKTRNGSVTIVSPAHAQLVEGLTLGQRVKIVIYGMILAAVFSVLLFIALDALDNAVKTASDAQRLLDLSVIGQIPTHVSDLVRGARIVALDPLSGAAESYRLLRTDLIFLGLERSFKTLVIAPVRPGQGATTTAGNLAIALAQSGRRVILVDADLRRPKLHAIFNVSNEAGLSSVLKGEADYVSALVPTDIENLTVLPAGAPVMNPSELVGSGMMSAFLKRLRDMAEYVVIDAPSPATFADGAVLASIADATLLVLRAGQAPDGAAEAQVRDRLEKARANVLGMVLNDVEPERLLGSRRTPEYQPALVSSNVGSVGSTPIPALPKPGGNIPRPGSTTTEGESDPGSFPDETPQAPAEETVIEVPVPKPQIRKPRIVSTSIPAASSTNGSGSGADKKAIRMPETPMVILLCIGLSTVVSALTLALSRAGQ